jgi:(1->4)-alpha-D-glucan 1-alpha-D-glucosylmutase
MKLRHQHAELFSFGDYHPLEVSGPHREHIIAFARRRGREAAITVVTKGLASFTQAGRIWPHLKSLEASVHLQGLSIDGVKPGTGEVAVGSLLRHLPAAVVTARSLSAPKRVRQRVSA